MRLRSLRKLEEFEIRKEFDGLTGEKKQIEELSRSDAKQWQTISWEIAEMQKKYGADTPLGKRRTTFADAPQHDSTDMHHAMIEKEPVTVVVSEKGWFARHEGASGRTSRRLTFKEGDKLKLAFHAETTDRILVLTTGGKFYTIGANKLAGWAGSR